MADEHRLMDAARYAELLRGTVQLSSARFAGAGAAGLAVEAEFSSADAGSDKTRRFRRTFLGTARGSGEPALHPISVPTAEAAGSYSLLSPSGERRIVVHHDDGTNGGPATSRVEIWGRNGLIDAVDTKEVHGKVYTDGYIGAFAWSADEQLVYYVAEKKRPPAKALWEAVCAEGEDVGKGLPHAGRTNAYTQSWGEQRTDQCRSVLFALVTSAGMLTAAKRRIAPVADLGSSYALGQVTLVSSREDVVLFTAWKTAPRKLGLTYCFQRPCGVFAARVPHVLTPAARDEGNGSVPSLGDDVTATATAVSLTPHRTVARCPSISACGSLLAFLSCREGADTHWTTVSLIMQRLDCDAVLARGGDEEEKGPLLPEAVACPVVDEPLITDGGDPFSGLYTVALHPRAVQLEKGFVVLDTVCGSRGSVVTVPIPDSGAFHTPKQFEAVSEGSQDLARHVSVVAPDRIGSYALLDVSDSNGMLLSHSSPSTPATLVWHTPQGAWVRDPSPAPIPSAFRDLEWEVITITPSKPSGATDNDFEAVLVYPTEQGRAKACEEGQLPPLILMPHGGPHSNYACPFSAAIAYYAANGYGVVLPNYRGSIGFGQRALDSLRGHVGDLDVSDCMDSLHAAIGPADKPRFDSTRLAVTGGSHGGFLSLHLIGQHPHTFRCALVRNPVTHIPGMVGVTDIPDWCWAESGLDYSAERHRYPTAVQLGTMRDCSPSAHVASIRVPVLFLLGAVDLRCPPSQGLDMHHVLRAQGVDSRVLWYPKDSHPLLRPATNADNQGNALLWFNQHVLGRADPRGGPECDSKCDSTGEKQVDE